MRFFFKNQVVVSRLKVTTGNFREYQSTATAEASVQVFGDQRSDLAGTGVFGKTYKIWCPLGTSIEEGDRIRDENGVQYDVREVKISQFGAFDYVVAIVQRTKGPND
jgi:hypothetical protein